MAESYRVDLLGQREVIRLLLKAETNTVPLLGRALYEEGQMVFRKSQKQVPFRFGVLKGSGRITEPNFSGGMLGVDIGYGGAAKKYAEYLHNTPSLRFRNGKKAHYLSDPLDEATIGLEARLLKRISKIVQE